MSGYLWVMNGSYTPFFEWILANAIRHSISSVGGDDLQGKIENLQSRFVRQIDEFLYH